MSRAAPIQFAEVFAFHCCAFQRLYFDTLGRMTTTAWQSFRDGVQVLAVDCCFSRTRYKQPLPRLLPSINNAKHAIYGLLHPKAGQMRVILMCR